MPLSPPPRDFTGGKALFRVNHVRHWPSEIADDLQSLLIGESLHISSGISPLGTIRIDLDLGVNPDVCCDAGSLPFRDKSFDTVLWASPTSMPIDWTHRAFAEGIRVTRSRLIIQHQFIPIDWVDKWTGWKEFLLFDLYLWQPYRSYFGSVFVISIWERK